MKKLCFFFLLFISLFQITIAQSITTSGSVNNEKGIPIPFAFVQDKQVKSATYTDSLGFFSLQVDPNSILLVSSEGYKDAVIKIENKTNLQVVLKVGDNAGHSNAGSKTNNANVDNMLSDAVSGHTNTNSAYNSNSAVQGGEIKFNGASFPVRREKEETQGSRYLFTEWVPGSVISEGDREVKNPAFLFKYDKIAGILLLTHDQKSAIEVDKDQVRSFTLYDQMKEPYVFEMVPAIDNKHFIRVLASGNKYNIYKLTKTKFIRSNYSTNGLTSSGNTYDEYVDENTYYVLTVKGNQVQKLTLKKKSIKEIFGNEGNKMNDFFTEHNMDSIDDHLLKSLGEYMNN